MATKKTSKTSEKKWQIRFLLEDELRWKFKEAADRRRLSIREALVEAVGSWIKTESVNNARKSQP